MTSAISARTSGRGRSGTTTRLHGTRSTRRAAFSTSSRVATRGYPDITVTTLKSRSFRHRYFEARMRWTKGLGAWPTFWLVSTRHAKNPAFPSLNPYCANHGLSEVRCWNSELDVFEGQGAEPHTFYGTLHRNTNDYYGALRQHEQPGLEVPWGGYDEGFSQICSAVDGVGGALVLRWPPGVACARLRLHRPADVPPLRHVDRLRPTPRTRRPRTVSEQRWTRVRVWRRSAIFRVRRSLSGHRP